MTDKQVSHFFPSAGLTHKWLEFLLSPAMIVSSSSLHNSPWCQHK